MNREQDSKNLYEQDLFETNLTVKRLHLDITLIPTDLQDCVFSMLLVSDTLDYSVERINLFNLFTGREGKEKFIIFDYNNIRYGFEFPDNFGKEHSEILIYTFLPQSMTYFQKYYLKTTNNTIDNIKYFVSIIQNPLLLSSGIDEFLEQFDRSLLSRYQHYWFAGLNNKKSHQLFTEEGIFKEKGIVDGFDGEKYVY